MHLTFELHVQPCFQRWNDSCLCPPALSLVGPSMAIQSTQLLTGDNRALLANIDGTALPSGMRQREIELVRKKHTTHSHSRSNNKHARAVLALTSSTRR